MISILLGGLFGGVLRGLLGISKTLVTKKEEAINYQWFFLNITVAAVIGLLAATMMGGDFRIALLAGYAGSDLLEGLFKIKFEEQFKKITKGK
jgi:fluoride ion exporter CrcB/FEX